MTEQTVFGKRVPRAARLTARWATRWQQKKYGFCGQPGPQLSWEPDQDEPWLRRIIAADSADAGRAIEGGVTVGTVRMGYGHLRMARTVATWSHALGAPTFAQDYFFFANDMPVKISKN